MGERGLEPRGRFVWRQKGEFLGDALMENRLAINWSGAIQDRGPRLKRREKREDKKKIHGTKNLGRTLDCADVV